jgi:hypothetical protein
LKPTFAVAIGQSGRYDGAVAEAIALGRRTKERRLLKKLGGPGL